MANESTKSLDQRWLFFSTGPGLGFDINNSLTISQYVRMNWRSKANQNQSTEADYEMIENDPHNFDFQLNIRLVF